METHLSMMATDEIVLANIEEELKRLWDEEQGKNRTRACFFNLVIYAKKEPNLDHYTTLVHSVISKFPCRVIFITSDPAQKNYLRTSVSTHALAEGIFCEVIHINVAGNLHERVPYIILPHILPDLPLYLLWTQDITTETLIFPTLERFASRVIFDPETTPDLQKTSQNTLSLFTQLHKAVADLHWSAARGWRKIFASVFDSPQNLELLQACKEMRIVYNQDNIRRAAYFQGWLASQLGWKFRHIEKKGKNTTITYALPHHEAKVVLTPYDDPLARCPLPAGAILEIEIACADGGSHFAFKRHPEARQVFYQHSDHHKCDLPQYFFLSGVLEGQEIIEEIFYPAENTHYQKMLELLVQIPWSEKG